jgi:hypothetical protein
MTAPRDEVVDPLAPAPEVRGDGFDADPRLSRRSGESLGDQLDQLFNERVGHGDDQTIGSRHVLHRARHVAVSGRRVVFAPLFAAGQFRASRDASKSAKSPANKLYSWAGTRTPDLTIMSRAL